MFLKKTADGKEHLEDKGTLEENDENGKHKKENGSAQKPTYYILRSCRGPEPAKLVEGLSSDLNAAWKYLDQNYNN